MSVRKSPQQRGDELVKWGFLVNVKYESWKYIPPPLPKQLIYLFCFLWLYLWHMEVPRLGVELELQLLAYATATAMLALHHSSQQHQILIPLRKARD